MVTSPLDVRRSQITADPDRPLVLVVDRRAEHEVTAANRNFSTGGQLTAIELLCVHIGDE